MSRLRPALASLSLSLLGASAVAALSWAPHDPFVAGSMAEVRSFAAPAWAAGALPAVDDSDSVSTNGCDFSECTTSGLWDGFEPDPPFGFQTPMSTIDHNGDGFFWSNPIDPPTAVIFPFGCETEGFDDNAVQVTVPPAPANPANGFVSSEYFFTEGGVLPPPKQAYSLRFLAKVEEVNNSQVDWEFSIHDGTNNQRVALVRFSSTVSTATGHPGSIVVEYPAGSFISTGVSITVGTCYDMRVDLTLAGEVQVYIDGVARLDPPRLPLDAAAGRMDYFRVRAVLNGASGNRDTIFRVDHVDLCTANDCNGNEVTDECDIAAGTSEDLNDTGIPDECENDCNLNGIDDLLDISGGTSADCNDSGVPDECEALVFVDAGVSGGFNNGTSWRNAYADLQDALTAASGGCAVSEIWVAAGVYTPASAARGDPREAAFQLFNDVAVYGGFAGTETSLEQRDVSSNATVLSGDLNGDDDGGGDNSENSFHVVTGSGTNPTAILDGFVITSGNADGSGGNGSGGGLYNFAGSPTVRNCTFIGNTAASGTEGGGAVGNFSASSPVLSNCTFADNSAVYRGGAMLNKTNCHPVLTGCLFVGNGAAHGGAMFNENKCNPTVTNSRFAGNTAGVDGGATYDIQGSAPKLANCTFSGNTASTGSGGAGLSLSSNPLYINCTFSGNAALVDGGGIQHDSSPTQSATFANCILWGNTDTGGGSADESAQIHQQGAGLLPSVSFCIIQGLQTGGIFDDGVNNTHNIAGDPLFVDSNGPDDVPGTEDDDLRLSAGSPAIDAGHNAVLPTDGLDLNSNGDTGEAIPFDLDGLPRIVHVTADLGAYEFPFPDCNGNGVDDADDIAVGTSTDCNANGLDDACEADCNANGTADDCDVAAGTSFDCNSNGLPDECEFAATAHAYVVDDGTMEDDVGVAGGGDQIWLNQFTVAAGGEVLQSVNIAWGAVAEDTPTTIVIWDDPDNDGNPSDAVVLATAGPVGAASGGTGSFTTVAVPPTFVGQAGDSFFVGALVTHAANESPAAADLDWPARRQSWAASAAAGMGDIDDLPGNATFGRATSFAVPLNWLLRAHNRFENDCNSNGIHDACDILAGTSSDCDLNGVPDECQGGGADDCNDNGVPDLCDIAAGTSTDCNTNGSPDECEPDCNANGAADDCDISAGTSPDCNANGVPDECDLAAATSADCNANGTPDECDAAIADCNTNGFPDDCDISGATSLDCNTNGVPDECDPDCNGNGVPDACDVVGGTSFDCDVNGIPDECDPDCNGNGTPDACDITAGTSQDCNVNGVPDECDVGAGTSADCNTNSVPDECDVALEDCNLNGVPDDCDVAGGTSLDCQGNEVPDECELTGADCNLNGIPDECEPDCDSDGVPDDCAIAAGSSLDCNANQVPDECDVTGGTSADCNVNLVPDECEVALSDCNGNGVPDDCDVAGATSSDCNSNAVPDECDILSGTSVDCQPNGTPDECETDCNGNGIEDSCDIAGGTSIDCQPDGTPDECGQDCNSNGIDDSCDLAMGTSADCNATGLPDECELGSTSVVTYEITAADLLGVDFDCGGGSLWGNKSVGFQWVDVGVQPVLAVHIEFNVGVQCHLGGETVATTLNGLDDGSVVMPAAFCSCDPTPGSVVTLDADPSNYALGEVNTFIMEILISVGFVPRAEWGAGVYARVTVEYASEADCNANGYPDECDVAGGTSADCDASGTPDECEFADCNANCVEDGDDIAAGTSLDCNASRVPDECEVISGPDFDLDGDVDLGDHSGFVDCLGGPGVPPNPPQAECVAACLAAFDFDEDGDVDLEDHAVMQGILPGG